MPHRGVALMMSDLRRLQGLKTALAGPITAKALQIICALLERLVVLSGGAWNVETWPDLPTTLLQRLVTTLNGTDVAPTIWLLKPVRVNLALRILNLLFALSVRVHTFAADAVFMRTAANVVGSILSAPDAADLHALRNVQSAAANFLASTVMRQDVVSGVSGGAGNAAAAAAAAPADFALGKDVYRGLMRLAERWLVHYSVEGHATRRRLRKTMDAKLLPSLLLLHEATARGFDDNIVATMLQERLQESQYFLKPAVISLMNPANSTQRVAACVGELVMQLCGNDPQKLIEFAGFAPSAGILMKRGMLGTGNFAGS